MNNKNDWSPILEGPSSDEAWSVVQGIASELETVQPEASRYVDPYVDSGLAGQAIFARYLAAGRLDSEHWPILERAFLGGAALAAQSHPMRFSLYGGVVGITWAINHLATEQDDCGYLDLCNETDAIIAEALEAASWDGPFDLLTGLVGLGLYGVERPRSAVTGRIIRHATRHLLSSIERGPHGAWWRTEARLMNDEARALFPSGQINLGVAHGGPGVIAFLSRAWTAGEVSDDVRAAVSEAIDTLLRLPRVTPETQRYPAWLSGEDAPEGCRLAWCYGDLSVALALITAGEAFGEPLWRDAAVEVAERAARRTPEDAGVVDPGICHGAAGIAHIFNRLFHRTQRPVLREAAVTWMNTTLAHYRDERGAQRGAFWLVGRDGVPRWAQDRGLLAGSAGVGLVLLAALTTQEPLWDRLLLMSPVGSGGAPRVTQ